MTRTETSFAHWIDGETSLIALLGHPTEHSLSPLIQNTALEERDVNAIYITHDIPPNDLEQAVTALRSLNYLGANVTIPHKETIRDFLDGMTPRAKAIGAVNTLFWKDDQLLGDNTDAAGFVKPLREHSGSLDDDRAVIFGNGGAARAAAYGLIQHFNLERLTFAVRSPERAQSLVDDMEAYAQAADLKVVALDEAREAVREAALVVNATPLGMHPKVDETPWPANEDFSEGQLVYDLVYNPPETRLLREASEQGAQTIDGLHMLIGQAAYSFERWTGRFMPEQNVRSALANEGF